MSESAFIVVKKGVYGRFESVLGISENFAEVSWNFWGTFVGVLPRLTGVLTGVLKEGRT